MNGKQLEALISDAHREAEENEYETELGLALSNYGSFWSALGYGDVELPVHLAPDVSITELVEDFGGGEGSGEERYLVFKVVSPDGEQLFKKNGAYYSYDGDNWDGSLYLVTPYEVTVTKYKKVVE